ncbi:ribonuclease E/G [Butyrivibrio sp. AE3004]|uniref:ribonuclease E/G n=1 Tax=Butyrivibrio sp. AE3004 TaxID=1506994 RepID=UPI00068FB3F8|nr:ribonuclease E/G [Butyrivibrio sp. AE3004]
MSEIIITDFFENTAIIGIHDNIVEYLDFPYTGDRTGNIYVGRVDNIVSNLRAAFIRFDKTCGKHGIGFLQLKSLPAECILNRTVTSSSELKPGDIVLVQLQVEEQKTKQARLTGRIDLSGSVFEGDIEKLISIAKTRSEYQKISTDNSDIYTEIINVRKTFSQIVGENTVNIITDNKSVYEELTSQSVECHYYDEQETRLPIKIHYSLTSKTEDLFRKHVWMKSGAFLIIEQTETLNLIDVNSGKNLKKSDEFFLELNREAAKEAYRQIRLRNLSGMILIDFISMKNKSMNDELISYIKELIKDDPMDLSFIDLTGLGIMEFVRKKRKKSLRETIDITKK